MAVSHGLSIPKSRKHLCANSLITTISESYEQIPDVRPNKDSRK